LPLQETVQRGGPARDRPARRTPQLRDRWPQRKNRLEGGIGHADVAFTMKQYVQTDLEANREVANTLADLISAGCSRRVTLSTRRPGTASNRRGGKRPVHKSVHKLHKKGRFSVR